MMPRSFITDSEISRMEIYVGFSAANDTIHVLLNARGFVSPIKQLRTGVELNPVKSYLG